MRVRVVHDKWIRLAVGSPPCLVPVLKAHVTAMGKNASDTWSAAEATVNLSSHPAVDVVLHSSSPFTHSVQVARVCDASTVEVLQTVSVDHRHIVLDCFGDPLAVVGAQAIGKHLVCKTAFIPAITYAAVAMQPYTSLAQCEQRFDRIMLRREAMPRRADVSTCRVLTMGSPAFRLYQHFNTTCTSKITSAFPTQSLAFAQSVCLAAGILANARNPYSASVLLAHSMQALPLDAAAAALLRGLPDGTGPRGRLSIRVEDGSTYDAPFVTVDEATRSALAANRIQTRTDTPMYLVFDRQRNAVLVADVCMQRLRAVLPGPAPPDSATLQVVADMHYVGVAAAYHPALEDRRQMLVNKCLALLVRPTPYTKSVFQMLRFEAGPMLALLAQIDLAPQ